MAILHRNREMLYNDDVPLQLQAMEMMIEQPTLQQNNELHEQQQLGADIVCIVDISGSMFGEKINLVKKTLQYLVRSMSEFDRFGLVTFNHLAWRNIRLTTCTENNLISLLDSIEDVEAYGGTDLEAGIQCGLSMLKERQCRNGMSTIMLMTDGHDRDIRSSSLRVQELIKHFSSENGDFIVNTFGYGDDSNTSLLNRVSELQNGGFYTIERDEDIESTFGRCLGKIISLVVGAAELSFSGNKSQYIVDNDGEQFQMDDQVMADYYKLKAEQLITQAQNQINNGQKEEAQKLLVELRQDCLSQQLNNIIEEIDIILESIKD